MPNTIQTQQLKFSFLELPALGTLWHALHAIRNQYNIRMSYVARSRRKLRTWKHSRTSSSKLYRNAFRFPFASPPGKNISETRGEKFWIIGKNFRSKDLVFLCCVLTSHSWCGYFIVIFCKNVNEGCRVILGQRTLYRDRSCLWGDNHRSREQRITRWAAISFDNFRHDG